MKNSLPAVILLTIAHVVLAADVHGQGAQGSSMGPVAFLWPSDRPWSADADNVAPCGSASGVVNRTLFPLGSLGSVELTIADEAYNIALRIAYGNDPSSQTDFQAIKSNVTELNPGHQCFSVPNQVTIASIGSNATLQLEYWGNDSNRNESFFACADITFIEASTFTEQIPCFNVTSSDFNLPASTSTGTTTATPTPTAAAVVPPTTGGTQSSSGLSGGAKAGIAVGVIGGVALLAGALFMMFRRRKTAGARKDVEGVTGENFEKPVAQRAASIGSEDTAH